MWQCRRCGGKKYEKQAEMGKFAPSPTAKVERVYRVICKKCGLADIAFEPMG
jgi:ribosomal protein L37E